MIHELPEERFSQWDSITVLGKSLLASCSERERSLGFFRLPPVANRKPVEWCNIPPFYFNTETFAAYPPDNVLAVVEGSFVKGEKRRISPPRCKRPATDRV